MSRGLFDPWQPFLRRGLQEAGARDAWQGRKALGIQELLESKTEAWFVKVKNRPI